MSLFQQTIEEVLWHLTKKNPQNWVKQSARNESSVFRDTHKMHLMHMTSVLMMLFILDAHWVV